MAFISVLFFFTLIISSYTEPQEILATTNACGYSTTFTATIFNAPYDGTISGVKAVYNASTSDPMTCDYGCSVARAKWGCPHCSTGQRKFMVEFMKVTNHTDYAGYTIYPSTNTEGYLSVDKISCSRGCTEQLYFLSEQDIDDDIITWTGDIYDITTDDQFMLQVAEGCCLYTHTDNTGYVCASIYFIYQHIYQWIVPSSPLLPDTTRSMAIGYDSTNASFWFIGGYHPGSSRSLITFINGVFIDDSIDIDVYGEGQYYTSNIMDSYVYIIHAPNGDSLDRFDVQTAILETNYTAIPTTVTFYGCITFIYIHDGYLVIVGGLSDGITDVQILNLSVNVWMDGIPSMQYARSKGSCAAVNGMLYAIGGYQSGGVYLDTVEVLNVEYIDMVQSQVWSVIGNLNAGMCCSRAVVYGYHIYIVGGYYYDATDVRVDEVHIINALNNEITVIGYMDPAFSDQSVIVIDHILYSFGGQNDAKTNTWRYMSLPLTDCESEGLIKHINWNNISNQVPYYDYNININYYQQIVEIDINLEYLGYSHDYSNNRRFYLIDEALTYSEGQRRCDELGSNLATITSETENTAAYDLCITASVFADPEGLQLGCWFGLNDEEIENTFVYVDRSNVSYTNWYGSQPNNVLGNEHCGRIGILVSVGEWYDDRCWYKRPVLCNQITNGYGTSYIVSLSEYTLNQVDNNTNPCTNRFKSSFEDKTFREWWTYSEYPFITNHLSNDFYLAYPPSGFVSVLLVNNYLKLL